MQTLLSVRSWHRLVCAGFALIALHAWAQGAKDVPPAVVAGSCPSLDFERKNVTSSVQFDLLVRVDDTGKVVSVQPLNDIRQPSLLSAVVALVKSCEYVPATSNGKSTTGDLRFLFPVRAMPPLPQKPAAEFPTVESLKACAPTAVDYPKESRKRNEEGTTSTSFTIDKTGTVTAFGVTKSSGFLRLDFVALAKLATCKFKPGTAPDGTPIGGTFKLDYNWKLE
jgi:TonB family protein